LHPENPLWDTLQETCLIGQLMTLASASGMDLRLMVYLQGMIGVSGKNTELLCTILQKNVLIIRQPYAEVFIAGAVRVFFAHR